MPFCCYFKICIVTFIVKTPTVQEYIDHIPWYFPVWSRNKEVTNVNSWFDSLETFIHAHKHIHECTQVLVKIWINGIRCKSSDTLFTSQCTLEVFPSPYTCIYFIIHCLQYSPYFGWILTWSLLFDRHLGCFHGHTSNLGVQKPSVVLFCFAHFSHDPLSNTESNLRSLITTILRGIPPLTPAPQEAVASGTSPKREWAHQPPCLTS